MDRLTKVEKKLQNIAFPKRTWGHCPECGKLLTEDDIYGHDCEVCENPRATKLRKLKERRFNRQRKIKY